MLFLNKRALNLLPPGSHDSHTLVIMAGIIISLLVVILAVTIANSRSSFFGRAAGLPSVSRTAGNLSLENSYLFASPVSASADGSSIIRVTVIILNDVGLGVSGQQVSLKSTGAVNIAQTQPTTDTLGRAIFDLTANTPGSYTISAELGGGSLPQTVSVSFR